MMGGSAPSLLQSLTLDAERAGAAMACRYGSADEYEAALIAERRAAGAYGRLRHRAVLWSMLAAAALVWIVISI